MTFLATASMRSTLPTDVPPYFWTIRLMDDSRPPIHNLQELPEAFKRHELNTKTTRLRNKKMTYVILAQPAGNPLMHRLQQRGQLFRAAAAALGHVRAATALAAQLSGGELH